MKRGPHKEINCFQPGENPMVLQPLFERKKAQLTEYHR